MRLILNVVGYQAVWMACVAGAGNGLPWLGPLCAAIFITATLLLGGKREADALALAWALPIGFVVDSVFAASGWLVYSQPWPSTAMAPPWICAIWASFAMTFNHSLRFLCGHPWRSALLGLVGGPAAYWSAHSVFGAVSFGAPQLWVLGALAMAWAATLPLLSVLIHSSIPIHAEAR